jgi:hypothetical protein
LIKIDFLRQDGLHYIHWRSLSYAKLIRLLDGALRLALDFIRPNRLPGLAKTGCGKRSSEISRDQAMQSSLWEFCYRFTELVAISASPTSIFKD